MNNCKKYQKYIVLDYYNELEGYEKADLDAHLLHCESCKKEKLELSSMGVVIQENYTTEPKEHILKALRHLVEIRLQQYHKPNFEKRGVFLPRFVLQFAMVVLLIGVGYFTGRMIPTQEKQQVSSIDLLNDLVKADQNVEFLNHTIDPYLIGINRLKFDQETGKVNVSYNTVNDIDVSASLDDPLVKELLLYALNHGENPNVRMHAVKAVNAIAANKNTLDVQFIKSIGKTLTDEENPGIRLFALRVLSSMSMDENIKMMLIHVLLYDANPALRIEAFKTLTRENITIPDIGMYLEPAQEDSNSFISNQSKIIIKEILEKQTQNNGPYELARRSQP